MTESWWSDSLPAELRLPVGEPLDGDAIADVAIVGAGYTGLWTAYWLLRADPALTVRIIEAEHAGFGASGRNGGWASALFPASTAALAAKTGRDAAIRMMRTMRASITDLGDAIRTEGWEVDWRQGGTIGAIRSPAQWARARAEVVDAREWGLTSDDLRLLDRAEAAQRIGATDLLGATYTPHCAALHPAKLVRSLARNVAARGGLVHEHTRATAIEPGIVRTDRGSVRAPFIVRATEGYTASLSGLRRAIAPVTSLMIATEPLSAEQWESIGLGDRETFHDHRHLVIYGQRTADDRLAFGGRGAPYGFGSRAAVDPRAEQLVHTALGRTLVELFPTLGQTSITHAWSGALGVARDWWASCGLDPRTGLAWSGGYVGDGVTTSFLGGRTLADLIVGRNTERTELPWVDHRSRRWEPEPLRWLGVNAGLRAVQAADAWEFRTGRPSRLAGAVDRLIGR